MNIHFAFALSPYNKVWTGSSQKSPTCIVERVYIPTEVVGENDFHYIATYFAGIPTAIPPCISFASLEEALQQHASFPWAYMQGGVASGIDWQPFC